MLPHLFAHPFISAKRSHGPFAIPSVSEHSSEAYMGRCILRLFFGLNDSCMLYFFLALMKLMFWSQRIWTTSFRRIPSYSQHSLCYHWSSWSIACMRNSVWTTLMILSGEVVNGSEGDNSYLMFIPLWDFTWWAPVCLSDCAICLMLFKNVSLKDDLTCLEKLCVHLSFRPLF